MKVNFLNKRNKWKIVTVYSQNIEETLDTLMEEINGRRRILNIRR